MNGFIMLFISVPTFVRFFIIMNAYWILSNDFSVLHLGDHLAFDVSFSHVVYNVD